MPKFTKKIVSPGRKKVGRLDGKEEDDQISSERIKSWVENTRKAQELGVLIPAPFSHQDKDGNFAFPVIKMGTDETLADAYSGKTTGVPPAWEVSKLNGGFWDSFDVDPTDGGLVGVVDSPGDENDTNTSAGKVGKTVKQTSILVMPGRRIVGKDGKEHEIGEHLAHVALCLHAQEPGQSNFEPLSKVPASLAMSFVLPSLVMDYTTGGVGGTNTGNSGIPDPNQAQDQELYEVVSLLRSSCGIALPEDVTREDFLPSLKLVLNQKLASEQENKKKENELTQRPNDAQTKSPTIAMSETTKTPVIESKAEAILMSMLNKNKKKELKDRIKKLLETGRIGKKYADEVLYPKVDAFCMSATDLNDKSEFNKSPLEDLLEGLETATPIVGESLVDQGLDMPRLDGTTTQDIPADVISGTGDLEEMSDAQMDELLNHSNL